MMTIAKVTKDTPRDYYSKDADYYTRDMTSHDKWRGKLSKSMMPLSKASYEAVRLHIIDAGKERIGMDCVFSAPKSVSLALAYSPEMREQILRIHDEALNRVLSIIEKEYIFTRVRHGRNDSKRELVRTDNMAAACFTHYVSRAEDLDLHTHCVIANATILDGEEYSIDYGALMDSEKELGLAYRRGLARGLQDAGFNLEVTDKSKGFFELTGFNRDVVEEYSTRRAEILATGASSSRELSKAARMTRGKKRKLNIEEKLAEIRRDLFDAGKINIERNVTHHGPKMVREQEEQHPAEGRYGNGIKRENNNITDDERNAGAHFVGAIYDPARDRIIGADTPDEIEGQESLAFATFPAMQNLQVFNMDEAGDGADRILHGSTEHLLAQQQSQSQRDILLQRSKAAERRRRCSAIAADAVRELAREKFAFTRREAVYRIMAAGVLDGIDEKMATSLLNAMKLIDAGRLHKNNDKSSETYLTTKRNIDTEKAILSYVEYGKNAFPDALDADDAAKKIELLEAKRKQQGETFTPTDEQRNAIIHALTCRDQFLAIQGLAGVGKTYSMDAMREMLESMGVTVRGMAFSGKAADGLKNDSGINSTTIHSFLNEIEKFGKSNSSENVDSHGIKQEWNFSGVPKAGNREIWVVDEAGLIDMHLMYQLMSAAKARGAQVILSGDYSQLPPIGAGKPYRQMLEHGMATAYLTDIKRQKNVELRKAVIESVAGDPAKTYRYLESVGNYLEIKDKKMRYNAITDAATRKPLADYKSQLVLTATNASRKSLNKSIRDEYIRRHELAKGEQFEITVQIGDRTAKEHRNFAFGDRIVFLANDKHIGIMNGTLATIAAIDDLGKKFSIITDAGDKKEFYIDNYSKIDYAYALTNYKAQGLTVQNVIADMPAKGASESRNALYVDISRAKMDAVIFTDDKELLEKRTAKFIEKITSESFEKNLSDMTTFHVENNLNYYAPPDEHIDLDATETNKEVKRDGHDSANDEKENRGASRENIEATARSTGEFGSASPLERTRGDKKAGKYDASKIDSEIERRKRETEQRAADGAKPINAVHEYTDE